MSEVDSGRNEPETIDSEDVDDVIGIASDIAERERQAADKIAVGDVVDIGEQLGLEAEHVEEAIDELQDREEAARARALQRARTLKLAGIVAGAIAVLAIVLAFVGRGSVRSAKAEVDKRRAQVRNVVDRQDSVRARLAGQPLNADREAELSGADNRVSIEKRRYDEAATEYNETAGSFPGSWGASLFGLEARVPLSSEIEQW